MKAIKLIAAFLVLAMAGVGSAWADHYHHGGGRVHFGLFIGPGWGSWYYPYPPAYYYPPSYYAPPVVVQPQPQVYVEQAPAVVAPAAPAAAYWYYCAASRGYYPYVKTCPGGWQKVAPQPE